MKSHRGSPQRLTLTVLLVLWIGILGANASLAASGAVCRGFAPNESSCRVSFVVTHDWVDVSLGYGIHALRGEVRTETGLTIIDCDPADWVPYLVLPAYPPGECVRTQGVFLAGQEAVLAVESSGVGEWFVEAK